MSAVNVLAVMDDAAAKLDAAAFSADGMEEARAAVAELIEAGALVAHERLGEGPAKRWRNMERFRAALARVGGAA